MLWSKDGGELPDIDRMIVEGQELTITTLNKTDNGTYRCEASNHLGSSSAEYVLFVYGEQSSERSHLFLLSGRVAIASYLETLCHAVTSHVTGAQSGNRSEGQRV